MASPERDELLERLATLPAAMRALPQWLLWRFVDDPKAKKPRKVPHYVDGGRRFGEQGTERDRSRLVGFDVACKALLAGRYDGLGFAFLPGDDLVGVDIDHAIDPESGEISELCREVIAACGSYAELSPSGAGVHIIGKGSAESCKGHKIGLELFCGSGYFTCTGQRWSGGVDDAVVIEAAVVADIKRRIDESKQRAPGAAAPTAPVLAGAAQEAMWLEQALAVLSPDCDYDTWIGIGMALRSALGEGGFRMWDYWSSKAGERYPGSERLQAHWKSFKGEDVNGALTVFKMARKGNKWRPPREWHEVYGGPRLVSSKPATAPSDPNVDSPSDARPEPPPPEGDEGGGGKRRRTRGGGGASGWNVPRLLEHYALIRGTDQVWDGELRSVMQVKSLRLLFGNDVVKYWLAHSERKLLVPEQIRFEPSGALPEGCVNLFDTLPVEPVACEPRDVMPMLDLLRHLTSLTGATVDQRRSVNRQVLQWCAAMVQRPGVKLSFALVFHGPQGAGKNLFWDAFRTIFGKYGKMVGQTELEDRFNGYMSGKLLLIGNEVVSRQELWHGKNKLKWVITENEIPIRGMHQEVRWESNHANLVFLSNELQPLALEKDDRRFLVVYTPTAADTALYARVGEFLKRDGAAKFMHYLQQHVPLEGFDEYTKPLMTDAKAVLIELGLKPAERFADEWLGGFLDLPVNVCSNAQLYRVFRRWCDQQGERFPPTQPIFTRTVERHVFERVERDAEGKRKPPQVTYKQVGVVHASGPRRVMRCWVPEGARPLNGVTEGEWAASAIDAFEAAVERFGRRAQGEER